MFVLVLYVASGDNDDVMLQCNVMLTDSKKKLCTITKKTKITALSLFSFSTHTLIIVLCVHIHHTKECIWGWINTYNTHFCRVCSVCMWILWAFFHFFATFFSPSLSSWIPIPSSCFSFHHHHHHLFFRFEETRTHMNSSIFLPPITAIIINISSSSFVSISTQSIHYVLLLLLLLSKNDDDADDNTVRRRRWMSTTLYSLEMKRPSLFYQIAYNRVQQRQVK